MPWSWHGANCAAASPGFASLSPPWRWGWGRSPRSPRSMRRCAPGCTARRGRCSAATSRRAFRPADAAEREFLAASGRLSEIVTLRSMARSGDGAQQSLIELKAVDAAYPLAGAVRLSPAQPLAAALAERDGVFGAAVEAPVASRLGLALGDRFRIGEAELQLRALIEREPDLEGGGLVFGPAVLIATAALDRTRLIRPGAIVAYDYRLLLPPGADPALWIAAAKARFPEAGWRLRSAAEASPALQRFLSRIGLFLSLVGVTTLLVGGIGIGNA